MGTVESEVRVVPVVRSNSLVIVAYGLMVILVGANAVAVRFSVAELPPFWGAALRFAAAALIFLGAGLRSGRHRPRRPIWFS